ncbi:hypothetical protein KCU81_g442, partial [Aureobasidium melanogenum]
MSDQSNWHSSIHELTIHRSTDGSRNVNDRNPRCATGRRRSHISVNSLKIQKEVIDLAESSSKCANLYVSPTFQPRRLHLMFHGKLPALHRFLSRRRLPCNGNQPNQQRQMVGCPQEKQIDLIQGCLPVRRHGGHASIAGQAASNYHDTVEPRLEYKTQRSIMQRSVAMTNYQTAISHDSACSNLAHITHAAHALDGVHSTFGSSLCGKEDSTRTVLSLDLGVVWIVIDRSSYRSEWACTQDQTLQVETFHEHSDTFVDFTKHILGRNKNVLEDDLTGVGSSHSESTHIGNPEFCAIQETLPKHRPSYQQSNLVEIFAFVVSEQRMTVRCCLGSLFHDSAMSLIAHGKTAIVFISVKTYPASPILRHMSLGNSFSCFSNIDTRANSLVLSRSSSRSSRAGGAEGW